MARVSLPTVGQPPGAPATPPPPKEPLAVAAAAVPAPETDEFLVPFSELSAEEVKAYLKDLGTWSEITELLRETASLRTNDDGSKARLQPGHLMLALLARKGVIVTDAQRRALFATVANAEQNAGVAQVAGKGTSRRAEQLFVELARAAPGGVPTADKLHQVLLQSKEPDALKYQELLAKWALRNEARIETREVKELEPLELETLAEVGKDMTLLASQGAYDEVLGRDEDIAATYRHLKMRKQNSVVLIGDKGVGKTSIAQGICQQIVRGEAPPPFENARMISTTPDRLIALGRQEGGVSAVLDKIVAEVKQARQMDPPVEIILVIDEIHNLTSDDAKREGLPELIKPYLADGEVRIMGMTTTKGYDQGISKGDIDGALADRLPSHVIKEPNQAQAVEMVLKNLDRAAEYYGVEIDRGAVLTAVELGKYADMMQPRAGKYWLEQACSMVQEQLGQEPSAIRLVRLELEQVEGALAQLQRDNSPEAQRSREMLEKVKLGLTQELTKLSESALKEKELLKQLERGEQALDDLLQSDEASKEQLDAAREQINSINKQLQALPKRLYFRKVDSAAVAAVVSKETGKTLDALTGDDSKNIVELRDKLRARVIGQDEAVDQVVNAVKRDRVKMRDRNKPIDVHFWPGQTGTGKTELAKALSDFAYDGKIIRIDCNEMMQAHELAKIMGAPPGYVGFDGGSMLAREIRKNGGRCVLLFDEVEKAHPDLWKRLMQVFDEGRLRDNDGSEVDLTDVHIVLTSNLGADIFQQHAEDGYYRDEPEMLRKFEEVYSGGAIPPEARARIKHRYIFRPHSRDGIRKIFDVHFKKSTRRLQDEHGITLGCSDALKEKIIEKGFRPDQGARLLNTTMEDMLTDKIVNELFKRMDLPTSQRTEDGAANEDTEQPKVLFWRGAYVMADVDDQGELMFREMTSVEKAKAAKAA